jgi:hypothetical protein
MIYNTQSHWIYGLSPSSGILINYRDENFLKDPKDLMSPSTYLKAETDQVSKTLCFLVFRIPDDGQIPETH